MTHAFPVTVDSSALETYLPRWDYADAYAIRSGGAGPGSAMDAAHSLLRLSRRGRWLMRSRDLAVRPVSLKPAISGGTELFPVLHLTPELAVLGLDDRHLDFRILIEVRHGLVTCTTAVRRHGVLGRAYFALVAPFHRRIVPGLLERSSRSGWARPSGLRPHDEGAMTCG